MNKFELDPAMDLAIKPSIEQDNRRRLFGRRSGGIAVHAAEATELRNTVEVSFAEEFGVESALRAYDDAWGEYAASIEQFTDDEEVVDLFDDMTGFASLQNGSRSEKRRVNPQREKVLQEITTATVLTARSTVNAKSEVRNGSIGFRDVSGQIAANRGIRGKLYGVVEAFNPSVARGKFQEKVADLEGSVGASYGKVAKLEDKIIENLYKSIDDPTRAIRLIEGFIETGSSEARTDKKFVQFLSTLHALNPANSVLARALETVRAGIEAGNVSIDFIRSKLEQPEGDNQYKFMVRLLEGAGITEKIDQYLAKSFPDWSSDMKQEYREYANQYISGLSTSIHRIASQNTVKLWVRPTAAMTETFIDDLFHRLHGKYAAGSAKKLPPNERQNAVRAGLNLQVTAGDSVVQRDVSISKETVEPKKLAVIANGLNGVAVWQNEGASTEEIIKMFVKDGKISKEYRTELTTIIEKLRREPLGVGTQLLRLGKRKPDATKFYRINPVHASMPVVEAKKARVIFAINGDSLGIYSLTTDYDRYRDVIDSLIGSKL